ncbi:MAG TPA: L-seryl-tRNA(Sec) selenium transferase, partial [Thermomicrobiales bacterium]|nr:L-seryl-tRNA(Sec) selenium transferase [Thermomicrobiales bacterium]
LAAGQQLVPAVVTTIVRRVLDDVRAGLLSGQIEVESDLPQRVVRELAVLSGQRSNVVINGTGVVIQTNLGRAPVSDETASAMSSAATSYVALETDLETGDRGGRGAEVESMMRTLTGAERTLVVNNNAAAVLLTLAATCAGRGLAVSRGEAVEIGGGFRIPDVLRQSGARLIEVGTTNRTYLRDYDATIDDETAAFLRVHASNFSIVGFVARPELRELAALARERGVLSIEDVGSGCLLDTARFGLDHEPTLAESIDAGVDVVCASGDKLLGGPQAGLILGRAEVVERIRRHPLARALRADKTCLAGIEATLRHYLRGDAEEQIPVWWAMSRTPDWLEARARSWAAAIGECASVIPTESVVGGGSLPGKTLPSFAVALVGAAPDALAARLRKGTPHVVPRIVDGRVAVDARTVLRGQDEALVAALKASMPDRHVSGSV